MKYYIEDEKVKDLSPCKNCDVGWGSYSNGKDENGEFIEIKSCTDDGGCHRLKEYNKRLKTNIR